ncbi:MAG: amidohydrolase [Firmicutes bacterium]|nr:amidohydrolase [Bacillota bacterium]MDY5857196.1 amidohydrolase [Anaerovoracaceae bacterium]
MKKVFFNAKVYVEKGVYAQAVLVEDGIIRAVGTDAEVLAAADADGLPYEKVDCGGRTMLPGLNDSHMHLLMFGRSLYKVKTDDVKSIDELVQRCRTFIKEHPDRVKHGMHSVGWNQDNFTEGEKRMPTRHDLDRISTEIPVVMERICGHMVSANTKAIEMLGFDREIPEIPGGEVRLEEDGFPSGIFTENACHVVNALIPNPTIGERQEAILAGMEYAVAHGLTSVQCNDVGYPECKGEGAFETYSQLYERGEALLRFRHQTLFDSPEEFEEYLTHGEGSRGGYGKGSWLTLGPLKLYMDGSLGARTAMMKNGYVGDPDNHGVSCITPEEMDRYCAIAKKYGVQVVTHAIGDLAIEETIDAYEKAFIDGENKLRHSVIHCQITDQKLIDRIVEKGILVQAQPIFMGSDMGVMQEIMEEPLISTSLNFGTMLRRGVHLSYGTDCPVEDCNPFLNLHQAINRRHQNGQPEGGFYPKECVDVETAIDAYTLESAYCEFQENVKGRIKPGYYADLIVLDKDIFTCDPLEIKDILPVLTVVGGKTVYQKDEK